MSGWGQGRPRVVIIGAGFGGLYAALALGRQAVDVVIVDRHNHHLFQPLLYQVATAGLSPADIASPTRWILRRQRNVQVMLAEATRIDVERRVVLLADGEVAFDYAIVATGATHAYFGHEDWRRVAPGLKTLEDALHIRRTMLLAFERAERTADPEERRRLLTFVIVGGGATGVELAGALAEITRHTLTHEFRTIEPKWSSIILLEGGNEILASFPPPLRAKARAALHRLQVMVRTDARVTAIDEDGVTVGASRVRAGVVLWAAGVAASPLGRTIGAPCDPAGRVVVNADLSVPGSPEVFVIGDLATFEQDGRPLPGVAPVAMQQAAFVAAAIARDGEGRPRGTFRYRDPGNLATIGRRAAIADFGRVRFSGTVAWLLWLFVHILQLQGFRSRALVLFQWAWAYVTYQRSGRLIVGRSRTP